MKKKRSIHFFALGTSLFLTTSCVFRPGSFVGSQSEKESLSESASSAAESVGPTQALKRKLSSNYHDYGEHNIAGFRYCPAIGSPKLLIIPVWFTDSSTYIKTAYKANVRNDIETAFFGTKEETGWNSVKSYYKDLSDGRLSFDGVVTDWWESGMDVATAGSSTNSTATLLAQAVDWYFSQENAEPRTNFDLDNDGYLDGVMLIYGAPDHQSLLSDWDNSNDSNNDNLWAYCSWIPTGTGTGMTQSDVSAPNEKAFLWASYDFMYSRNKTETFSRTGSYFYGQGDTTHCLVDAHTFIHESGHMLGFHDYYDYSSQYNPAGGFSMQDENVGSHDPYSVLAAGWVDPIIPFESTTVTIHPFQNEGHDLVLLTNAWNGDNSPFDEYLLLELYTPTGLNELDATYQYKGQYPQGPSETGIRIWHVDSRLIKGKVSQNGTKVAFSSTSITDPTVDGCYLMQSNTSYNASKADVFQSYGSPLGSSYADYNLLQVIKNDTKANYKPAFGTNIKGSDLFKNGSTFNQPMFSKQFVEGNELNCKDYLGWAFDVEIKGEGEDALATLTIERTII